MLVTADWHVRKYDRVWYRRDTLRGDTTWGITEVRRIAEEQDVRYVLLLGDLFEQKLQQSDALQTMSLTMDAFQAQNRRVLYVQGQHEKSSPPIIEAIHRWPRHIHQTMTYIPELDLGLYGLDYQPPTSVEAALRAVPHETGILATHQVWKDFMGEQRGDAWMHWCPQAPFIFTGDFHETLCEHRGSQCVMSPGPLCMQSISEPAAKYVYIVNDDMTPERIRLHSRGYYEARLHNQEELDRFLDTWHTHPAREPGRGVPVDLRTNIIRVWYHADLPEAEARLKARVGYDAHLFLKAIPVETAQVTIESERRIQAVRTGGLAGCIREFYADDPHVCEDAVRLARTRDIPDEMVKIFKERMNG